MFESYPILKIISRPRKTVRNLINNDLFPNIFTFTFFISILSMLVDNFEAMIFGSDVTGQYIKSFIMSFGVILIYIYLIGEFYQILGRQLGGVGTSLEIRSALLWASVPQLVGLLVGAILFMIVFMNLRIQHSDFISYNVFRFVKFSNIINSVGSTISGFFQLLILSEVHNISFFKGFVLLVVGLLITIITFIIVSFFTLRILN